MDDSEKKKRTQQYRLEHFTTPTGGYGPFIVMGLLVFGFVVLVCVMMWLFSKQSHSINPDAAGNVQGFMKFFKK